MSPEVQIGFAILAGIMLTTWLVIRLTSTRRKEDTFVLQFPDGNRIEIVHRKDSGTSLDEEVLQAVKQWEIQSDVNQSTAANQPKVS